MGRLIRIRPPFSCGFRKIASQSAETSWRENPSIRERIFAPMEYEFRMLIRNSYHARGVIFSRLRSQAASSSICAAQR